MRGRGNSEPHRQADGTVDDSTSCKGTQKAPEAERFLALSFVRQSDYEYLSGYKRCRLSRVEIKASRCCGRGQAVAQADKGFLNKEVAEGGYQHDGG